MNTTTEPKFYTAYGPRKECKLSFLDQDGNPLPSKTKQCHKKECDINNIIKQYDKRGLITHVNQAAKQYGDYSEINEYKVNLEMVIKAQQSFDGVPSEIRKQFANDPGLFFEFVTNPENQDQMVEMGLAAPLPIEPTEVPETAPETTPEGTEGE